MEFEKGEYNFNKDLISGENGEKFIGKFIRDRGMVFDHKRYDNKYDLAFSFNQRVYTYEIKTDIYPRDTGNIVVEFECRGKPSGISVTTADYFVNFFPHLGEIWNIKTKSLLNIIQENNLDVFQNSGDKNSNTKLYKIPKKKFESLFKVYRLKS